MYLYKSSPCKYSNQNLIKNLSYIANCSLFGNSLLHPIANYKGIFMVFLPYENFLSFNTFNKVF